MISVAMNGKYRGPFRLKKVGIGAFQIHQHNGSAFEGPQNRIFPKAVELGVFEADLYLATAEMEKLNHDCADFGIGGRFIRTRRSSEKDFS